MADGKDRSQQPPFSREVLTLFDHYVHGIISRRGFLEQCAARVGGVAAASGILAALSPNFASAAVAPTDGRIKISSVDVPSPQGYSVIRAYVARPSKAPPRTRLPLVLVVHENRGLNPHIEDIARRLAVDGYLAYAPDALTPLGGYPGDEDKARALFGQLDQARTSADFEAVARHMVTLPDGNAKLGAVGFCYGGGVVNRLASRGLLLAGAPFYGAPAPLSDVPAIKGELSLHFAGNDTRINGMWPPYEAELKKAEVKYQAYVYPNVEHGFNNDTTPRFNADAAALAWSRTVDLFKRNLT